MKHSKQRVKQTQIPISFTDEERERFNRRAADRLIVKGQLLRYLCLAWMDPITGPAIEEALRSLKVEARR